MLFYTLKSIFCIGKKSSMNSWMPPSLQLNILPYLKNPLNIYSKCCFHFQSSHLTLRLHPIYSCMLSIHTWKFRFKLFLFSQNPLISLDQIQRNLNCWAGFFFSENVFHKHLGLFNNLLCTDITLFFGPLVLTFKQGNLAEGLPQQCHCIYSEWKCMKNVEQFPLFSNT